MIRFVFLFALICATPLFAVQPSEMLSDPVQEARARELGKSLRCVVCKGETIDDSNAQIASDMRIFLREMVSDGQSDDEILNAFVSRYGEFVLMKPKFNGRNAIVWLAGPVLLLLGGFAVSTLFKKGARQNSSGATELNDDELARLNEIMEKDQTG